MSNAKPSLKIAIAGLGVVPYPGQQTQIPGCLVLSPDHKPGNFVLGVVAFITQVVEAQRQVSGGQLRHLA